MEKKQSFGKIVVVDDNQDVLFALRLLLEPMAKELKLMRSPENIGKLIQSFAPDIILLDMNFTRDASSGDEGFYALEEILAEDPRR